ncbi:MAG: hypothetical protein PHS02_01420 [Candidatus ainarchaeum sp.]|nr:hypothetical protein [Candidatus ainarchaeum sp.]
MTDRAVQRITLVGLARPNSKDVKSELVWVCRCLDLDPSKDKLAFDIFLHLLDASRKGEGVKTIEIKRKSSVTQAAVVYHMNTFMRAGLIVRRGRVYYLRGGTLEKTVEEMEADVLRRMRLIKQMAERIDETLFIQD